MAPVADALEANKELVRRLVDRGFNHGPVEHLTESLYPDCSPPIIRTIASFAESGSSLAITPAACASRPTRYRARGWAENRARAATWATCSGGIPLRSCWS